MAKTTLEPTLAKGVEDIADERNSTLAGHPWSGVDLVIIRNATPRQLVGVSQAVGGKCGTGFVCCSPCSPLTHHRLKPAPRCESLRPIRQDVLRELANQQTTGERAGYGGGGITALQGVLAGEQGVTNLRRRQKKHANAQREHQRQRRRAAP